MEFKNCEIYHNILFYVLSYIDFESVEDCFAPVLKTITESFQLNEEKNKELYETYYSKPEISYDDNSKQLTLKKKSFLIMILLKIIFIF